MLTLQNHLSQSLAGVKPPPTISITAFANLASSHSYPFSKVPRHVFSEGQQKQIVDVEAQIRRCPSSKTAVTQRQQKRDRKSL